MMAVPSSPSVNAAGGSSADSGNKNNHSSSNSTSSRQIPIVCPGHTRPLAELQFCTVREEGSAEPRTVLVSACHDSLPMVRDGTTGNWIGTFAGHKGAVWSCQLDPTGSLAATASGDYSVKVWDGITGKELHHFAHHQHIVKSCEWSPNSLRLVTGGREGIVRIYDLTRPHDDPWEIVHTDDASSGSSKAVVVTKCGWLSDTCVVTGGDDGKIRFWDVPPGGGAAQSSPPPSLRTAPPTHVLETDEGAEIRDFELKTTTSGQQILTVAAGTKVYFFDLQPYARLHAYTMPIHFRAEGGASLHPSGSTFVAGGSDLWVRVCDFHTGRELDCLKGHHGPIRCLRYAPDGRTFASGSEDGTIRLWKSDPTAAVATGGGDAAGVDE